MRFRRLPEAGRQADKIYQQALAAWRRRIMPRAVLAVLPFLGGGLALGVYTNGSWRFVGGVFVGMAITLVLWVRDDPPAYVQNWSAGAEGERRTERVLLPLAREGWSVRHDLPARYGNIDHVAIGPGGIFLLDSKAPSGNLEVRGDRLIATRLGVEALTSKQKTGSYVASAAHDLWFDLGGVREGVPKVHGVAVIWGKLDKAVTTDRFSFVPGSELARWLEARTPSLTGDEIARLTSRLDTLSASRTGVAVTHDAGMLSAPSA